MPKTVNFNPVSDYDLEAANIERRRKMAEQLAVAAGQFPDQTQVINGVAVKQSPLIGAAKLAQALVAHKSLKEADEAQKTLSERMNQDRMSTLTDFQSLMQGKPGQYEQLPQDVAGPPQELRSPVAPDPKAAMMRLMQSGDPMFRQMATQQILSSAMPKNPLDAFSKINPKDYTAESIAQFAKTQNPAVLVPRDKTEFVNGIGVNPYDVQPGTVIPDPNKPFNLVNNGQGGFVAAPNAPFQNYEIQKAGAGASRTTNNIAVNTEKQLLGQVGDVVGKSIGTNFEQAKGAVNTINTVNQIRDAVSSGNVNLGPGATAQQFLGQVGIKVGVGGKNDAERLQNTRKTIQGLAQLELDGAAQLKGQGQITEGERDIVRRAASGQIDNLTKPELLTLMDVLDKSARLKIASHNDNMTRLKSNPNAKAATDFMEVKMPPMYSGGGAAQTAQGGNLQRNPDGSYTYSPPR